MLPELATEAAAAAVIIGIAFKPWRLAQGYRARAAAADKAKHDALRVELHAAAQKAADDLAAKLMRHNGGNSLFDVARAVEHVTQRVEDHMADHLKVDQQVAEVHKRVDGLLPLLLLRQADIARKLGADNRASDHECPEV